MKSALVFIFGLTALLYVSAINAEGGPLGTCTVFTPEGTNVQSGITEQFCIEEMSGGGEYVWEPDPIHTELEIIASDMVGSFYWLILFQASVSLFAMGFIGGRLR